MSLITAMWHACSLHGWFLSSVTISSMRRSCRKDSSSATICINSSPTFDFLLSSLELLSCRRFLGAITIGHYRLPRSLLLQEPGRQKDMWCKIGLPSRFQQAWLLTWKGKLIYGCWCSLLKLQLRGRNPPRTVGASLGPRTYPKQTSKLTAHTGPPYLWTSWLLLLPNCVDYISHGYVKARLNTETITALPSTLAAECC